MDQNKISAMGDILRRMQNVEDGTFVKEQRDSVMSDILNRFRSVTDDLREDALDHDDILLEAFQTERTDRGVRISEWEIIINEGNVKTYDVVHDEIIIAKNLRLYEAALALTQELNAGSSINSSSIKSILLHEDVYSRNIDDMIRYKRMMNDAGKKKIASVKLDEAKRNAIYAKKMLKELRSN